jgi:hypothetical protein
LTRSFLVFVRRLFALALLAFAAACGGSQGPVALPAKHPQQSPLSPVAVAAGYGTAKDQVVAAYAGYWQAYAAATRSRSITSANALLAPYTTRAWRKSLVRPLPGVWAYHDQGYGYAVPHVLGIHLGHDSARLHDCLDLTHFGTQNFRTGRVFPGTFGRPRLNFYVTLLRAGGRWMVSRLQQVEVPCAP